MADSMTIAHAVHALTNKWAMTSLVLLANTCKCQYTRQSLEKAIGDLQFTRRHHWTQLRISPNEFARFSSG